MTSHAYCHINTLPVSALCLLTAESTSWLLVCEFVAFYETDVLLVLVGWRDAQQNEMSESQNALMCRQVGDEVIIRDNFIKQPVSNTLRVILSLFGFLTVWLYTAIWKHCSLLEDQMTFEMRGFVVAWYKSAVRKLYQTTVPNRMMLISPDLWSHTAKAWSFTVVCAGGNELCDTSHLAYLIVHHWVPSDKIIYTAADKETPTAAENMWRNVSRMQCTSICMWDRDCM